MSENQEIPKEPTREEVIAWYKSQIELAALRTELAELQSRAVKAEAERIQAAMFLAQLDAASKESAVKTNDESPQQAPESNSSSLKRV